MRQNAPVVRRATNVALVITAVVIAGTVIHRRQPAGPGLSAGSDFPALVLIGLNGDTSEVEFTAEERDRLVVFYSIDCGYCQLSLPVYRLVSEMCDPSLTLVFTDLSQPALAAWWEANRAGFSEQCSSLSIGRLLYAPELYRVRGTPTHYLVGSDGRVKHHAEGMLLELPAWLDR